MFWLDYEDPLSQEILYDIRTVASRAFSGTVISITVPCEQAEEVKAALSDAKGPSAIERFRTEFGRQRVNQTVTELSLVGWPFGKVCRGIILAEIEAALAVRNGQVAAPDVVSFTPICDIEYDDGTKMTTVTGIFATARDRPLVVECGFNRLDFMPASGRLVRIRVPRLTAREARSLEQKGPKDADGVLDRGPIPADEGLRFCEFISLFA